MIGARKSVALNFAVTFCLSLAFSATGLETLASEKKSGAVAPAQIVEEKIGGRTYQTGRLLVKAKPEHVWQILTDYDNAQFIFPGLKKCKVVKNRGNSKLVEHEIKPSGLPGSFAYVLEIKETANKLQQWHRISGDFNEVEGFWKLEPLEDGQSTQVTYASYVNGGFFIPQALIKRQVRMDVPPVLAALKSHAETSRQIASRHIDSATQSLP